MSGKIDTRLSRLEATVRPKDDWRSHEIMGGTYTIGDGGGAARAEAEGEERKAELIREGKASPDDFFLIHTFVRPGQPQTTPRETA